ncbi:hypothetical protein [Marisediminicola sp. LYQ85]|uniref:hypothetical protein n=1 Tax=Marisediminicola sp. LYQ85 TaxID=3391062 RepID=UPI003982F3D5
MTVGTRHDDGRPPRIGDDVTMGAYAQIIGDIDVGNACTIGAMTLVLDDVESGATVVGNPGRVIRTG